MEKTEITIETLDTAAPGKILATGTTTDTPDACFIANTGLQLNFVAVVGGAKDWALYVGMPFLSLDEIKRTGDKVSSRENVAACVSFSDEVWKRYRQ